MTSYSIKNQADFNRIYPTLSVMERGKLGMAFPEYYDNYMNMITTDYQNSMKAKATEKENKARKQIDQAVQKDIKEEFLKAVAGKDNKYFKPFENQQQRDKYAAYIKQQKALKSAPKYKNQYQQMIYNEAVRQGIDPNLALAVAYNESRFNPNSKNISKGDPSKGTGDEASYGLFQINTLAHPDYKGGLDPQKNIEYGIRLLKGHLQATKGNVREALARYNGSGPAARNYSNRVFGIYQDFSKNGVPQDIRTYTPSSQVTSQVNTQPTEPIGEIPQINIGDFWKAMDKVYSAQNAQEGALNNIHDTEYLDLNKPSLIRQQMVSDLQTRNPSSKYLDMMNQAYQNTYDLARQAGGYGLQQPQVQQPVEQKGQEDMIYYNDFNDPNSLNGYVTPNTMAPVPTPQDYSNMLGDIRGYAQVDNQPQNIRQDVLADYLKVIEGLRGQRQQQNAALLQQMQKAQSQDALQNSINQAINSFGALGNQGQPDFQFLAPNGQTLITVPGRRYASVQPLPTNTTANMDAFKNELAMQQKTQQNDKDLLDRYQALAAVEDMSKVTGLPAGVFLNPDLYKSFLTDPYRKEEAQFKREAGIAPINLSSKLAEQSLVNQGNVDVANINALAGIDKAGLTGEYQLQNTALGQTLAGANDYRKAMLNAQTQERMNRANVTARMIIANMDNETKMEVARLAGANARDLAKLQDYLYSNNPLRQQQADAQLTGAMANLLIFGDEPEQGFSLYNRIINMRNGSTPTPTGELNPSQWND